MATRLLALLPKLGQLCAAKLAVRVGLALLNRDSGHKQGKRTILSGLACATDIEQGEARACFKMAAEIPLEKGDFE